MTIDVNRFQELKAKAETLTNKYQQTQGALDNLKATLKEKYNVSSLNELIALRDKTQLECDKLESEQEKAMAELEGVTDWTQV